jgi:Domain of unknown function (DUF4873)
MTEDCYHVVVLGVERAERRLTKAGITDFAVLESCDPDGAVFDEATHTWTLPTCRARIVISDQIRCGREGLVPYLGVAAHGVPNYFMVTGADAVLAPRMRGTVADARLDYIAECLKLMRRTGSTRIEVRYSTQRMFHDRSRDKPDRSDAAFWRRMRKLAPSAFDLSSHVGTDDDLYDGAARIRIGDDEHPVRVRLSGHLDPIDGRYHWQGTVFGELPDEVLKQSQPVTLTIGERSAEGRINERTPQGNHSVVGVGAPPYALDDVEFVVPSR